VASLRMVWPGGQLKPRLAALAGAKDSVPTMLPFPSAVNCPDVLTVVEWTCLFEADGFLPRNRRRCEHATALRVEPEVTDAVD
jgi:hypothetical protein